jgi:hypothetical protein
MSMRLRAPDRPLNGVATDANFQPSSAPDALIYCDKNCVLNIAVL